MVKCYSQTHSVVDYVAVWLQKIIKWMHTAIAILSTLTLTISH